MCDDCEFFEAQENSYFCKGCEALKDLVINKAEGNTTCIDCEMYEAQELSYRCEECEEIKMQERRSNTSYEY